LPNTGKEKGKALPAEKGDALYVGTEILKTLFASLGGQVEFDACSEFVGKRDGDRSARHT
jgi:hypothetical protein